MSLFDMENRQEPGAEAPAAVCWPQWADEARLGDALAAASRLGGRHRVRAGGVSLRFCGSDVSRDRSSSALPLLGSCDAVAALPHERT